MPYHIFVDVLNANGGTTEYKAKGETLDEAKEALVEKLERVARDADRAAGEAWKVADSLRGAA